MDTATHSVLAHGCSGKETLRRLEHGMSAALSGEVVRLITDFPGASTAVEAFCVQGGHALIVMEQRGPEQLFLIRKA